MGMWFRKCSIEAIEGAVELGGWKRITDLNSHPPLGFWAIWIVTLRTELADMNFTYGTEQGNDVITQRTYMKRYQSRNFLDLQTFERLQLKLCANGSFYDSRHNIGTERYRRIHTMVEAVLRSVEYSPSTSSTLRKKCSCSI